MSITPIQKPFKIKKDTDFDLVVPMKRADKMFYYFQSKVTKHKRRASFV